MPSRNELVVSRPENLWSRESEVSSEVGLFNKSNANDIRHHSVQNRVNPQQILTTVHCDDEYRSL